jgi:hypothetical protein
MTMLLALVAILIAVTTPIVGLLKPAAGRYVSALAWASLFAGVGLVFAGLAGSFADALAVASLATSAMVPMGMKSNPSRRQVLMVTPVFALALAGAALVTGLDTASASLGPRWLLLIVQAGLIAAAMSAAVSASAIEDEPERGPRHVHLGLSLVMVALAAGLGLIGALRATLPGSRYALTLATAEGPLLWGWSDGPLQGQNLPVIITVDWMLAGLAAIMACTLAAAFATRLGGLRSAKLETALHGGAAALALGLLGNLMYLTGQSFHPSARPYEDLAKRMLSAEGLPEALLSQGRLLQAGTAKVDLGSMGPEILILGIMGILAAGRAWQASKRPVEASSIEAPSARLWRRDLMVRSLVAGWLAWLVGAVFHLERHGVVGVAAPAEWLVLGGLLLSTGIVLATWEDGRAARAAAFTRRAAPGILAGTWILILCAAYGFGAYFAVSALLL